MFSFLLNLLLSKKFSFFILLLYLQFNLKTKTDVDIEKNDMAELAKMKIPEKIEF